MRMCTSSVPFSYGGSIWSSSRNGCSIMCINCISKHAGVLESGFGTCRAAVGELACSRAVSPRPLWKLYTHTLMHGSPRTSFTLRHNCYVLAPVLWVMGPILLLTIPGNFSLAETIKACTLEGVFQPLCSSERTQVQLQSTILPQMCLHFFGCLDSLIGSFDC